MEFSWISPESRTFQIETSDFHICCSFHFSREEKHKCSAEPIWPFSCSNLLGKRTMSFFAWLVSVSILILNIISLLMGAHKLHISKRSQYGANFSEGEFCYELNITSLHAADFLNGCHLLSLVSASTYYGDRYIAYDKLWRKGFICNAISVVSLFSNTMSIYILGLLAASRLAMTLFPLHNRLKRPSFVIKVLSFGIFIISIYVIISAVIVNSGPNKGQTLPLCVLYGVSGNIYSIMTSLYGLIQLTAVIIIPSLYIYLLKLLHSEDKFSENIKSKTKVYFTTFLLAKLCLVNISNIICWLPSSVVLLLSLILKRYPIELLFWVVLILTPFNSIFNPIILRFNKKNGVKHAPHAPQSSLTR